MARISTHYDVLQVAPTASDDVIRGAYRALIAQWQPDGHADRERARAMIQRVSEAYAVLSNPARRREHDAWIGMRQGAIEVHQAPLSPPSSGVAAATHSLSSRVEGSVAFAIRTLGAILLFGVAYLEFGESTTRSSALLVLSVMAVGGVCLFAARSKLGRWVGSWLLMLAAHASAPVLAAIAIGVPMWSDSESTRQWIALAGFAIGCALLGTSPFRAIRRTLRDYRRGGPQMRRIFAPGDLRYVLVLLASLPFLVVLAHNVAPTALTEGIVGWIPDPWRRLMGLIGGGVVLAAYLLRGHRTGSAAKEQGETSL
jgi:hypothetical protein